MKNKVYVRPTLLQRCLSRIGRWGIPRLEGVYARLGILDERVPRPFECDLHGLRYEGRLDQRIDQHIYFFGDYSPNELAFLDHAASVFRSVRKTVSFVDIGANVGQHTLFMSSRVTRVLAFEPGDEAAAQLLRNLGANGIKNVTLSRLALGSANGIGQLGSGFPGNNGSRSLNWSLDAAQNATVQIAKGDDAIGEAGVSSVNIVKMDVEGHEKEVLVGAATTFMRDRPVLLFELVGGETKGGFASEVELRNALYPDHILYALAPGKQARLLPYSWSCEEAVCVPVELAEHFRPLCL